jgi:protein involved in polysaccharide export with SLBB domain
MALAALAATSLPSFAAQPDAASAWLRVIQAEPEGRLVRVTLKADGPIQRYTLSRQGPPEKRDLAVRLPGFASEKQTLVEVGDYLLPIEVVKNDTPGADGIKVVLGNVGDSLVSVAQDGTDLSIVIIAPEKKTDLANAYHIGVNDSLQIDVFGHEDLNKTLKASPKGLINFPLIGNVRVEGRTVDDVAGEITERLAKDFIQDPHVTVSVWEYLSQWVNVIGEVAHPGRYYMTGATSLIDAISQAGGLTGSAGSEILVTRRPEEVDPASAGEVFRVDIRTLFSAEAGKLNMRLRPGDIVNVVGAESPGAARR